MTSRPDLTGLILAGGAGRRAGGRDKGLVVSNGKPLVEHVYERLAPQVGDIIISCNRNISHYKALSTTTVTDSRAGYQGPLAGIEAALPHIRTDLFIVVPCDSPQLPTDLVARLAKPFMEAGGEKLDVSFAHDGKRAQYLSAAIRRRCLPALSQFLDQGHRAVRDWYQSMATVSVDFSDQCDAFSNLNELK
jgi:molybdopterin-guanine dinucleotide biosynthesis protein A